MAMGADDFPDAGDLARGVALGEEKVALSYGVEYFIHRPNHAIKTRLMSGADGYDMELGVRFVDRLLPYASNAIIRHELSFPIIPIGLVATHSDGAILWRRLAGLSRLISVFGNPLRVGRFSRNPLPIWINPDSRANANSSAGKPVRLRSRTGFPSLIRAKNANLSNKMLISSKNVCPRWPQHGRANRRPKWRQRFLSRNDAHLGAQASVTPILSLRASPEAPLQPWVTSFSSQIGPGVISFEKDFRL